ncbi:MAG: response regulator [Planctomycetota bacterium]|nr:response regulator [Planctomycetota bacterium]
MPRILLIDDNAENRDWLSRRLERRGFEVLLAVDGRAGVDTALAEKPDLILMDMNMPQVDGWEATRQIKAAMATLPVIALTAHALAGDRERALQAGCTDYHTKPIDFPKLLSQIESLLETPGRSLVPPAGSNSSPGTPGEAG